MLHSKQMRLIDILSIAVSHIYNKETRLIWSIQGDYHSFYRAFLDKDDVKDSVSNLKYGSLVNLTDKRCYRILEFYPCGFFNKKDDMSVGAC